MMDHLKSITDGIHNLVEHSEIPTENNFNYPSDNSTYVQAFNSDYAQPANTPIKHIMTIDNGNGIKNHPDLRMPTPRESLDICKEWDITPVIEIKNCDTAYLPDLKAILDEYGLSDTAAIISFTKEYLEIYRELDKDIEILYLSHVPTKEDIDWCAEHDFGINFNHKCLYKCFSAIKYAREKGITIAAWTVDNTIYADIMVLFGAEYITTNKILP